MEPSNARPDPRCPDPSRHRRQSADGRSPEPGVPRQSGGDRVHPGIAPGAGLPAHRLREAGRLGRDQYLQRHPCGGVRCPADDPQGGPSIGGRTRRGDRLLCPDGPGRGRAARCGSRGRQRGEMAPAGPTCVRRSRHRGLHRDPLRARPDHPAFPAPRKPSERLPDARGPEDPGRLRRALHLLHHPLAAGEEREPRPRGSPG